MAKKKKVSVGAPKKPDALKLKKRMVINITETDYAGFVDYKTAKGIGAETIALRQLFHDALEIFRKTKGKK